MSWLSPSNGSGFATPDNDALAAGASTPTPTLVTSLAGATLQDPNSLDAGSTGFNTSTGTFTFDMNATVAQYDGYNEGPIHYVIPLTSSGGLLENQLDLDAGDILRVFAVPESGFEYGDASCFRGCGFALVNASTLGSAGGMGLIWYRTTVHRLSHQNSTNGAINTVTPPASPTHFEAVFYRFPEAANTDIGIVSRYTSDNGATWVRHNGFVDGSTGVGDVYLAVMGTTHSGASAIATELRFKLYLLVQKGPGQSYAPYT